MVAGTWVAGLLADWSIFRSLFIGLAGMVVLLLLFSLSPRRLDGPSRGLPVTVARLGPRDQPAAAADGRRGGGPDARRRHEPRRAQRRQRAGRLARRPRDRGRLATAPALVGVRAWRSPASWSLVRLGEPAGLGPTEPSGGLDDWGSSDVVSTRVAPGPMTRMSASTPDAAGVAPPPGPVRHPADRGLVPPRQLPGCAEAVGGPPGGLRDVLLHRRPARDHCRAGPQGPARPHAASRSPSSSPRASTRSARRSSCRARCRPTPRPRGCSSASPASARRDG